MGCDAIPTDDGGVAFICRGRSRRRADCEFFGCRFEHVALCDAPVGPRGRACSRRMCEDHRTRVSDDVDACPDHVRVKIAARALEPVQLALVDR